MGQIYLTSEQAHRLSALACDALVGLQIEGDARDDTAITGVFISFDQQENNFRIEADGAYIDTT